MPLLALIPIVLLVAVALIPVSIMLRYRAGTSRRVARGWLATINAVGFGLSSVLFLATAAVASAWVPQAFTYSLAGLAGGCLAGLAGLAASRWEPTPRALYYTPNRWLVLSLTLVVTARLGYGVWRSWHAWGATADGRSWLAVSGVAGSMAAGAVVLGYYLTFWLGVRRRARRHQERSRLPG